MRKTGILKNSRGRSGFINPNSKPEDDYIKNLHRQIHFIQLEIEAFQKKQKAGKEILDLKGLSTNNKGLPLEHLIEAKEKFTELQKKQKEEISRKEDSILKLKQIDFEFTTVNQINERKKEDIQQDLKNYRDERAENLKLLAENLDSLKRNNYEIFLKLKKLGLQKEESKKENDKVMEEEMIKEVREKLRQDILRNEFERLKQDIEQKDNIILELNKKKNEYQEIISNDASLVEFEESNKLLHKSFSQKEKEFDILNYEIFTLNHLQKLAIEQKENQVEEKRKLLEQVEILRGKQINFKKITKEIKKIINLK